MYSLWPNEDVDDLLGDEGRQAVVDHAVDRAAVAAAVAAWMPRADR